MVSSSPLQSAAPKESRSGDVEERMKGLEDMSVSDLRFRRFP
jgi:hypothetical protein